ncbi:MAG: glycosyltransferase family 39 protein [Bacteroidia bacterium]|nr:glycosyltransferase family 39 protein [Bacteroidia bacterium]MCF8426184.1 glycosyltransferase family 39 protein [Bacteroidia bacterium]MCF8445532.1 glycosyltransferase family 39 protein [Bacteroidia bacterium]
MKDILFKYDRILVFIWGLILFVPFLGSVHLFDWDEVNFAESAREMLLTGNYQKVQINFKPFMEKPPLFFWLQALSMKVFGVNEFAARFPNALVGIATLLLVFNIGKKWFSTQMAFWWVLFISGSITPHLYFKTGIIDPIYNLFIFSAVYQLFLYTQNQLSKHAWLLGMFIGLAIITKGPVAVVVVVLLFLVFLILTKFKKFFLWKDLAFATLSALLVSALWFGVETWQSGPSFLVEFIKYQADLFLNPVAGHGQPFWYHPVVLLLGCFPASVFALPFLINGSKQQNNAPQKDFHKMMQLFFWVVLILFSIVETKIVHYSSLCYLPLTFLAAQYLESWQKAQVKLGLIQRILFSVIGIVLALAFIILPLIDYFKDELIPYIKDDFAVASLSIDGGWTGYESLPGVALLLLTFYTMYCYRNKQMMRASLQYLLFTSFLIPTLLIALAVNIEKYSQGPAIQFFQSLQGKDVYVETLGYKSYAQYFYSQKQIPSNSLSLDAHWMQTGNLDKPAYFSLHINNINDHINSEMKEIGRKGGFVFYERLGSDSTLKSIVKP